MNYSQYFFGFLLLLACSCSVDDATPACAPNVIIRVFDNKNLLTEYVGIMQIEDGLMQAFSTSFSCPDSGKQYVENGWNVYMNCENGEINLFFYGVSGADLSEVSQKINLNIKSNTKNFESIFFPNYKTEEQNCFVARHDVNINP